MARSSAWLTNAAYAQETLQLASGDLLVASADGLSDAPNPDDEEFGEDRMRALLIAAAGLPAEQVKSSLCILNSNARRTA